MDEKEIKQLVLVWKREAEDIEKNILPYLKAVKEGINRLEHHLNNRKVVIDHLEITGNLGGGE